MTKEKLPKDLRTLVRDSIGLLGEAIKKEYGAQTYQRIEKVRQLMKHHKAGGWQKKIESIEGAQKILGHMSSEQKYEVAHSYSVMLEIFNACENAYRTYRLQSASPETHRSRVKTMTFVLTAHPTEARSPECLAIFQRIFDLLLSQLKNPFESFQKDLLYLIILSLKTPMSRREKPTVEDEANHIFSLLLRPNICQSLIDLKRNGHILRFRSWVGGDKDGHPGVNEKTFLNSLTLSRKILIQRVKAKMQSFEEELDWVASQEKGLQNLVTQCKAFYLVLKDLERIGEHDGRRVSRLRALYLKIAKQAKDEFKALPPVLDDIGVLFDVFPALVVPLEFREDSSLIHEAVQTPGQQTIEKMLIALKKVSKGSHPQDYVGAFVISMTESAQDMEAALKLSSKILGGFDLPVVPLFETEKALVESVKIIDEFLAENKREVMIRDHWDNSLEVMVGYSDSSKESGSLYSKTLIAQGIRKLDASIKKHKIQPKFFHGSGGSVARGGGSIEEQTAWWPLSAIEHFKATIQGEMVHRIFSSPEIFESHVLKIANQVEYLRSNEPVKKYGAPIFSFSNQVKDYYRELIQEPEFLELVAKATPYSYLNMLKIGSRPAKRSGELSLKSLRAIPWILCWTQTRLLLPVWWGVGSAWKALSDKDKKELKRCYNNSNLFRSYIKLLAFTLAKVELPIWKMYLNHAQLDTDVKDRYFKKINQEYLDCLKCVRFLSGESSLLWFRPWLEESIKHRAPMIHPLNILQLEALDMEDQKLLRETVTGVAIGMLTTG